MENHGYEGDRSSAASFERQAPATGLFLEKTKQGSHKPPKMSVGQNDDYQPGLLCPACPNTFGGSHDAAPMKTPGCDHLVCANCAGAAPASSACFVCKQDTTSKKYTESTGMRSFSDRKLLELHLGLGAARGCADCVALGDPPQLAVSLCGWMQR